MYNDLQISLDQRDPQGVFYVFLEANLFVHPGSVAYLF